MGLVAPCSRPLTSACAGGPDRGGAGGGALHLSEPGGVPAAAGEAEPRAEGQAAGGGGPGPVQAQGLHRRPGAQAEGGGGAAGD